MSAVAIRVAVRNVRGRGRASRATGRSPRPPVAKRACESEIGLFAIRARPYGVSGRCHGVIAATASGEARREFEVAVGNP